MSFHCVTNCFFTGSVYICMLIIVVANGENDETLGVLEASLDTINTTLLNLQASIHNIVNGQMGNAAIKRGKHGSAGLKGRTGPKGLPIGARSRSVDYVNTIMGYTSLYAETRDMERTLLEISKDIRKYKGIVNMEEIKIMFSDHVSDAEGQTYKLKGEKGPPGRPGEDGSTGLPGLNGDEGSAGRDGISGIKGDIGLQGYNGERGPPGISGSKGEKGDIGSSGISGAKGVRPVIKGQKGAKGERGMP